jgi:hypothetical protein
MASEDFSPVRSNERRNSLEKHLQHRPEAQDLKNRHILLDTTTAPYVPYCLSSFSNLSYPSFPTFDQVGTLPLLRLQTTVPYKPKLSSWSASVRLTTSAKV